MIERAQKKGMSACMLVLGVLLAFMAPGRVWAEDGAMRTNISNASPLLLSAVYGDTTDSLWWGNTLEGAWKAIPDDVKPYAAIELHPAKVCKPTSCIPRDTPELRAWYTNMLDTAQKNNIPVFMVIMSAGERNTVPAAWLDEQFQKYSVLKGVMNIENYWIYNDDIATHSAQYLEVCAKNGAHFIWHDHENWFWQRVMSNKAFRDAAKKHAKNLVLATKNTPIRDDASTDSVVNGLWLSGYCGNWGSSTDTWKWWEKGYTDVFEAAGTRGRDMRSYASEPETMIAMEMMNVYTNGGTVYNFECAAYTFMDNDRPTPAFTKGIIPMFRRAISHPAPSRDEVRNRTKAVFWEKDGAISTVQNFYTDLYSDDETMPLYDTGRYSILPVIPADVTEGEINSLFPHAAVLTKSSPEMAHKVEFLNARYPRLYDGTAYAQRVGESWYAYNSEANTDKTQEALLPLYVNPAGTLGLTMAPHTYAIVDESPDKISITLQNYRVSKRSMWEQSGNFDASQSWKQGELDLSNWLSEHYCVNPDDSELQETTIILNAKPGIERPRVSVGGDEGRYSHEDTWDAETGRYTMRIRHNGEVRIALQASGDGPAPLPSVDPYGAGRENIARGKQATQSSTDYGAPAARAVDGNRNGDFAAQSVTHTATSSPSWWQVDLGKDTRIEDIAVFNRTDAESQRLSNYDVELLNAQGSVVWSVHRDRYPISSEVLPVGGIAGRTVRVRLRDANVPLSLAEVEVYASAGA